MLCTHAGTRSIAVSWVPSDGFDSIVLDSIDGGVDIAGGP